MRRKSLSRAARKELLTALRDRYVRSTKIDKGAILKRVRNPYRLQPQLRNPVTGGSFPHRAGSACPILMYRIYDEAVKESLIVLWEAADSDLWQTIASDIAQPDRIAGRAWPPAA